jgi:hypothetical protein
MYYVPTRNSRNQCARHTILKVIKGDSEMLCREEMAVMMPFVFIVSLLFFIFYFIIIISYIVWRRARDPILPVTGYLY